MGHQEAAPATRHPAPRWVRPPGLALLGPVQGSGLTSTSYLVEREDGQMIHLSDLAYAVLRSADADRSPSSLAAAVTSATGRTLPVEVLDRLVRTKLEPMGLLLDAGAGPDPPTRPPRARPVLALSLKGTLLPPRATRRVARALTFLFWTPLVVAVVVGVIALDVLLWQRGNAFSALESVLVTPEFLLMLFALMTLGALVHECGHAVACAAGGAQPGAIGFGVYLLFPAFYTDVTTSYRLDRAGRLRTDLGGLYFNLWCLLAAGGGYLLTDAPVLLLVVLLMHVEMAQQLVPTVRFDGYFVLSDLAGVPDLFARVRPVLVSLLPGRPADPRVAELRPGSRRVITVWVLAVVPMLAFGLVWLIVNLPRIIMVSVGAIDVQARLLASAWTAGQPAGVAISAVAMVLLAVPLLGLSVLLPRLVLGPIRWAAAGAAARRARA